MKFSKGLMVVTLFTISTFTVVTPSSYYERAKAKAQGMYDKYGQYSTQAKEMYEKYGPQAKEMLEKYGTQN